MEPTTVLNNPEFLKFLKKDFKKYAKNAKVIQESEFKEAITAFNKTNPTQKVYELDPNSTNESNDRAQFYYGKFGSQSGNGQASSASFGDGQFFQEFTQLSNASNDEWWIQDWLDKAETGVSLPDLMKKLNIKQ